METVAIKFTTWIRDQNERINPDLREIVYHYGMMSVGSLESWNKMWSVFKNETDLQEKNRLMRGLAGIRESWIIQKYIDLGWDETHISRHDYLLCLHYIVESKEGRHLIWDHLRNNWTKIVERYTFSDRNLQKLILSLSKSFCTNVKLREMNYFFDKYPEMENYVKKLAVANIQTNILWINKNANQIEDWLDGQDFT